HAACQQGANCYAAVDLTVAPLRAQLVANPGFLNRGMTRGTRNIISVEVSNVGGAASGALEVQMPNVPWLSLVSEVNLPSLSPSDKTTLTLALSPAADLPLTRYDGSL